MSSSLLLSLPPALRRSAGFLAMLRSVSLHAPSWNPNWYASSSLSSSPGHGPEVSFRLVPRAQASGGGRSVWEEAAEDFFRAKERKPAEESRSAEKSHGRVSTNARSGRREWDGEPARPGKAVASRSRSPGSQHSQAVSFAGKEWGDADGEGSRATSNWSKAPFERRSSKPSWSTTSTLRTGSRERPTGYKSDRGAGYGGERRMPRRSEDGDEEGDDEESEDWPRREAVNWRLEGEAVYGVAPIRAALLAERRVFHALYVQEGLVENAASGKRKDKQAVHWVLQRAHNLEIKVETMSKQSLNLLVDNRPHQGLVLDASPLELVPCEHLERPVTHNNHSPVWVALDEVIDPQNFGAILRSCHYLGAAGVVVCAKNSAPLSGVVSKASAGALEVMEIQSCRNMMRFLDMSVQNGWRAVGASSEPRALPINNLEPGSPTILVLGNEGRGLRTNVKRSCTELVSITGFGASLAIDPAAVDSLNVSVAAGILLHDLLSRSIQTPTPHFRE